LEERKNKRPNQAYVDMMKEFLLFLHYFQAITFTSNIISTSGGHQGLSQSRDAHTKKLSTVCCTPHW